MVGLGNLRREVQLSGDDLVGDSFGELALLQEACVLGGGRTRHHDYRGEVFLRFRFIKQRNIDAEPAVCVSRIRRPGRPTGADRRMEDVLELAPFRGIGKGNFAQPSPVGLAGGVKSLRSESIDDSFTGRCIMREQIPRTLIGVEKLCWQVTAERCGKGGFSRGDAASDAERGHRPRYLLIKGRSNGRPGSGGAIVSTTSSFSSSARTGSPAGLISRAETKMTRLRLRC